MKLKNALRMKLAVLCSGVVPSPNEKIDKLVELHQHDIHEDLRRVLACAPRDGLLRLQQALHQRTVVWHTYHRSRLYGAALESKPVTFARRARMFVSDQRERTKTGRSPHLACGPPALGCLTYHLYGFRSNRELWDFAFSDEHLK